MANSPTRKGISSLVEQIPVHFALWAIMLVVITFLFALNERLWGRHKVLIGGVLALGVFAMCGGAFYVWGWKAGSLGVVAAFVLGAAFDKPALWLARKLTDYPDLGVAEYNRQKLNQIGRDSEKWLANSEKERQEESRHMAVTVSRARTLPEIQDTLERNRASEQDLEAFYRRVEIITLPPDLRAVAVSNPAMFDWFLANSVPADVAGEYTRNVDGLDASFTLQRWAAYNPGAEQPP